jgi:lysophospholipase L1-like esterase
MVALCLVVAAALLTFPNAIPWMIAFWLGWYSVAVVRGRRGWPPLALGAAIVLVKGVPPAPGLIMLAVVTAAALAAGVMARQTGQPKWTKRLSRAGLLILWLAWMAMAADWHAATRCNHRVGLHPTRPVVCLGNSLTSMGPPQGGYPEHLAKMLSVPAVNLGESGINTTQAVAALPRLVAANPQVVVIELGEHDFLQECQRLEDQGLVAKLTAFLHGRARRSTQENLQKLIDACRGLGAEVVLVEMPRGYMFDLFFGLERQLARENDLELIPDTMIRRLLLSSPTLPPGKWLGGPFLTEPDGVHPSPLGNDLMARYVAEALERLYGPKILRQEGS